MRRGLLLMMFKQGFCCHWCGIKLVSPSRLPSSSAHPRRATIDHVMPRSKGGTNTRDNRVAACFACNQAKADKLPAEWSPPLPPRSRAMLAQAAANTLSAHSTGHAANSP